MIELLDWSWLLTLDIPPPTSDTDNIYPTQGQGFAAYLVGGFMGLGIVILAAILLSLKPRRAQPPPTKND